MKLFIAFIDDSNFPKMSNALLKIVIIILDLKSFKINITDYSNFYRYSIDDKHTSF